MLATVLVVRLFIHPKSDVRRVLGSRMLLVPAFDPTNVDSPTLSIAFLAIHVVAIANLLTIRSVDDQFQLCPRRIGSLKLPGPFVLLALALFSFASCALCLTLAVGARGVR